MASRIPLKEGKAEFKIPSINEHCFTYYKIIGHLSSDSPAVVVAHGGPGAGHEYMLPFTDLWSRYSLPVVFYDQIGCASSTHLPEKAGDHSFWQESLFIAELNNLVDHLHLRDNAGFHLLGQSWGGCLGAAFAATSPRGLRRLVLASALACDELYRKGLKLLTEQLPLDTRNTLDTASADNDYESRAFQDAQMVFYKKHLCRVDPFPSELMLALKNLTEDETVYKTMMGPSVLAGSGSLANWSCISRLPDITAPTLVYNGEFDTSTDVCTAPFFELIPRVRWITLANAGHMCHLEGGGLRKRIMTIVGEFLTAQST